MALFIRDPEVDALAEEVKRLTKAKSKTGAVRAALAAHADALRRKAPCERLAEAALADKLGETDRTVDMKAHMDEMWDGL